MLNATLCATGRAICCLLENYQEADGVRVPEVRVCGVWCVVCVWCGWVCGCVRARPRGRCVDRGALRLALYVSERYRLRACRSRAMMLWVCLFALVAHIRSSIYHVSVHVHVGVDSVHGRVDLPALCARGQGQREGRRGHPRGQQQQAPALAARPPRGRGRGRGAQAAPRADWRRLLLLLCPRAGGTRRGQRGRRRGRAGGGGRAAGAATAGRGHRRQGRGGT